LRILYGTVKLDILPLALMDNFVLKYFYTKLTLRI